MGGTPTSQGDTPGVGTRPTVDGVEPLDAIDDFYGPLLEFLSRTHRVEVFSYCDIAVGRDLLRIVPEMAVFLPCRITVMEDADKNIWVMTLDWDVTGINLAGKQMNITPELRQGALAIRDNRFWESEVRELAVRDLAGYAGPAVAVRELSSGAHWGGGPRQRRAEGACTPAMDGIGEARQVGGPRSRGR